MTACSIMRAVCASLLITLVAAAPASAERIRSFHSLFVFGDSLSDTGNDLLASEFTTPPPTRYFFGRFSNGPVWAEFLAASQAVALVPSVSVEGLPPFLSLNYAYGGSGSGAGNILPGAPAGTPPVPGLQSQVTEFLGDLDGEEADPSALYVVWTGANDYLFPALSGGLIVPCTAPGQTGVCMPTDVVGEVGFDGGGRPFVAPDDDGNIVTALRRLYEEGARNFLVINLPGLDSLPLVSDENRSGAKALVDGHNQLLELAVTALNTDSDQTEFNIILLNVNSLLKTVAKSPTSYGFRANSVLGFTDVNGESTPLFRPGPASGCLLAPSLSTCYPISFYSRNILWDEQHPTTRAHYIIAREARRALWRGR